MKPQYLRNEFYQKKSPLFHVGSYMKKTLDENDQVSERLLSMVFKNISEKHVIAIQGVIHNFNPFNESLTETPFTVIEIPNFKPGTLYGETVYFKVHKEAVIFKIEIKRVTYTGFETETFEDNTYDNIERSLDPTNEVEKQYILDKFNQGYEYIQDIKIEETYYHCVCGTMNHIKNSACIECKAPKESYIKIFKEEKIKQLISDDADLYVKSVFKNSVITFDIDDIVIDKLIHSRGKSYITEVVQKEKQRYENIHSVIKPYVNQNNIDLGLFDRLTQRIDKINQAIEKKKQREHEENLIKVREEKRQDIIKKIKKDIDYGYFVLDLDWLIKEFNDLENDLKIIKVFYEFKSTNKENIVSYVKEKSMNIFDSNRFRNNILFLTCISKNKKLKLSNDFDEYNQLLNDIESEIQPYLKDYSIILNNVFNLNHLILTYLDEKASYEDFFQSIINRVIKEEKINKEVALEQRKSTAFCLTPKTRDSFLKLEFETEEAKDMIKNILEKDDQSRELIKNTQSMIRKHFNKKFLIKFSFIVGLGIPHIFLFNLIIRDSTDTFVDIFFVLAVLAFVYFIIFFAISFWYSIEFPEEIKINKMKQNLFAKIEHMK